MENPETTLFIGGLPDEATEATLEAHFIKYGVVSSVKVIRFHPSGKSRGFGFVTFSDPFSLQLALLDSHDHRILGTKVGVRKWKQVKQHPRGSQELMTSQQPQSQSTRTNSGYRSSGTNFVGGVGSIQNENNSTMSQLESYFKKIGLVESNNRSDRGVHQPDGSSSCSDYIDRLPPINNGLIPPGFGWSTSGIGVNGDRILLGEYAGVPSGILRNVSPKVSMDETFDVTPNFPQPGGSSSCFVDTCSPAPTNNGVPHPHLGRFTSGIGVNGGRIRQDGYTRFPSGISLSVPPQVSMNSPSDITTSSPRVLMDPSGIHQRISQVSMEPSGNPQNISESSLGLIGTGSNVPPVLTYPYFPTDMTRNMRQVGVIGPRTRHNRETSRAMDQRGFVSENTLADVNSSRDEYETLDFDGTAGQGFSQFPRQP